MAKHLHEVVWTEGMYLAPHHFQAQGRFFEDRIQFAADCFWRYSYGFLALKIDRAELRNGVLRVSHASGIMPDGFVFDISEHDAVLQTIDVAAIFPHSSEPLDLFLALPAREDGKQNVASEPVVEGRRVRLREHRTELADVNRGQDSRTIAVGKPNLRIAAKSELSAKDIRLPLARVVRDGSGDYLLDPRFIPPCLHLDAGTGLLPLLDRMMQTLEEKNAALRAQRNKAAASQLRNDPRELVDFWMLHAIDACLPGMRHLCRTQSTHPEQIYLLLVRLAGALCTFAVDSEPSAVPEYSHDSLGSCFIKLDEHIRRHLEILIPSNCVEVPLSRYQALFYRGAVDDPRLFGDSRWVLGIATSASEFEMIHRIPEVVKLSSRDWVERIVRQQLPGVPLSYLSHPPASVPPHPSMLFFSVDRGHPLFQPISNQKTIGIYVPEQIVNPELRLWVVLGKSNL